MFRPSLGFTIIGPGPYLGVAYYVVPVYEQPLEEVLSDLQRTGNMTFGCIPDIRRAAARLVAQVFLAAALSTFVVVVNVIERAARVGEKFF